MRLRSKAPSALRSFKTISHTRFRRPVVRLGIRPSQSSDSLRHEILKEIFVPLSLLFLFSIFSCISFLVSRIFFIIWLVFTSKFVEHGYSSIFFLFASPFSTILNDSRDALARSLRPVPIPFPLLRIASLTNSVVGLSCDFLNLQRDSKERTIIDYGGFRGTTGPELPALRPPL